MLDKHLRHPFCLESGATIQLESIHLARIEIARVAMFLCHAWSPLPGVQEASTSSSGKA